MPYLLPITDRRQGFTLVELMVTIALIGIIVVIGVPLTAAWLDRSKANSAAASLKSAIFEARVLALRNTNNQLASATATSVCIDTTGKSVNIILLAKGATNVCGTSGGNQLLKSMRFDDGVVFKQANTTITGNCFAFNATGMLTSTACAASLGTITVEKNNEKADVDVV